jgi:hypothetical protein
MHVFILRKFQGPRNAPLGNPQKTRHFRGANKKTKKVVFAA